MKKQDKKKGKNLLKSDRERERERQEDKTKEFDFLESSIERFNFFTTESQLTQEATKRKTVRLFSFYYTILTILSVSFSFHC